MQITAWGHKDDQYFLGLNIFITLLVPQNKKKTLFIQHNSVSELEVRSITSSYFAVFTKIDACLAQTSLLPNRRVGLSEIFHVAGIVVWLDSLTF